MENVAMFKNRIESDINKAYSGGVSLLPFLDEAQLSIVDSLLRHYPNIYAYYDAGFSTGDRKRLIISPYEDNQLDFKIMVYQIVFNKSYYSFAHRNVLGALLSLGIKRECIGDIVIKDNQDIYFACSKEIADYIVNEFHFLGKAPIELKEEKAIITNEIRYETKTHFLSSLRLDCVIASAYNLSRAEALDMIEQGLVFIKHVVNQNPSYNVKLDEEISVRHKGRVKIASIGSKTKSGRIIVDLAKRV